MEQSATNAHNGMESISKANESTKLITSSNIELTEQIHQIDRTANDIKEKSDDVAESMKQISDNTVSNCNAVEQVSAATQENSAGTESLAGIVEKIKELSKQLNEVVHG
ncbi:MAG: methyl-accepting chemotaxis protein [Lachnospiraceae bacterium]|nr:methyl-accepting chemotaxis protein [Lachnospiraceae bacterium]